jgi:hypothetical protein
MSAVRNNNPDGMKFSVVAHVRFSFLSPLLIRHVFLRAITCNFQIITLVPANDGRLIPQFKNRNRGIAPRVSFVLSGLIPAPLREGSPSRRVGPVTSHRVGLRPLADCTRLDPFYLIRSSTEFSRKLIAEGQGVRRTHSLFSTSWKSNFFMSSGGK